MDKEEQTYKEKYLALVAANEFLLEKIAALETSVLNTKGFNTALMKMFNEKEKYRMENITLKTQVEHLMSGTEVKKLHGMLETAMNRKEELELENAKLRNTIERWNTMKKK